MKEQASYRCDGGSCHQDCVQRVPVFRTLKAEELSQVAALVQRRDYAARQTIFHQGDAICGMYIVRFGRVKLTRTSLSGEETILTVLNVGDFYGADAVLNAYQTEEGASAMEESGICFLPREGLLQLLRKSPDIGIKIIDYLSRMRAYDRRRNAILSFKDAGTRVAELLLWQTEQAPDTPLTLSQEEMAGMAGLTHETVNRKLALFKRRGYIDMDGYRRLRVLNRAALMRIKD